MSARSLFSLCGSEDAVFDRRHKEPVWLNVYDLCNQNDYSIAVGLGVFHSGIQLYGIEYCFGGHDLPATTGIIQMEPCNKLGDLREIFSFRESIFIGYTHLSKKEVERIVDRLGRRQFTSSSYHMLAHNCNREVVSVKLSKILCGRPIPDWVNRLANLIARVPFVAHYLARPRQRRQRQRNI